MRTTNDNAVTAARLTGWRSEMRREQRYLTQGKPARFERLERPASCGPRIDPLAARQFQPVAIFACCRCTVVGGSTFEIADFGVVGDLFTVVPQLTEAVESRKG